MEVLSSFTYLLGQSASAAVPQETDAQVAVDEHPNLPTEVPKPSFLDWLETLLPFKLPRIPLPQTARNLDKSAARLFDALGTNAVARVDSSTNRHNALSRASTAYIELGTKEITGAPQSELSQRALSYVLNEATLRQNNREAILQIAAEELHDAPPEIEAIAEIEDDWLNQFSRFASEKSDADIQRLWGRILAGEIRSPGSVKLRTLATLSSFDREDAIFTHDFLSKAVNRQFILASLLEGPEAYRNYLKADELALIGSKSASKTTVDPGVTGLFEFGSEGLVVISDRSVSITCTVYPLTTLGIALCNYIHASTPDADEFQKLKDQFKRDGLTVWAGAASVSPDGRITIAREELVWPVDQDGEPPAQSASDGDRGD